MSVSRGRLRDKEGWMEKQGGRYKSWKRRYFRFLGPALCYYKDDKYVMPFSLFLLLICIVVP